MTSKLETLATAFVASMDGLDGPRQGYEVAEQPQVNQTSVALKP